jgi:hypothetical protein
MLGAPIDQQVVKPIDFLLKGVEAPRNCRLVDPRKVDLKHADPLPDVVHVGLDRRDISRKGAVAIWDEFPPELHNGEKRAGKATDANDEQNDAGKVGDPLLLHNEESDFFSRPAGAA